MAETHSCNSPYTDTDAAGNCKVPGCDFNSDEAHYAAAARGEDVYGFVPEVMTDEELAELRAWEEGKS